MRVVCGTPGASSFDHFPILKPVEGVSTLKHQNADFVYVSARVHSALCLGRSAKIDGSRRCREQAHEGHDLAEKDDERCEH